MSLQPTFPREIPEQTRVVGETIMEEDDVCYYLGQHIGEILSEEDFVTLYSETGRGGIHPFILAMVTVLQYLEKYPDRRASQQVVKRMDWKYALHQELTWGGFHYSDLCNFRKRLLCHEASGLVFEKLLQHLQGKGWLKGKGKQRTDATHIVAQVQRYSQLEFKWEGLRMALVDLISTDAKWVLRELSPELVQQYATSRNTYRLSKTQLEQLEAQLDTDLESLLHTIEQRGQAEWLQLRYVRLVYRLVREQLDCIDPDEFPDWEDSALELDLPDGLLNSVHEPEARMSQKGKTKWNGYKTHITETVVDEGANFITDVLVTPAPQHDSQTLTTIQERLQKRDLTPTQQYVDQGYMSATNIDTSATKGIDLRGRVRDGTSSKPKIFQLSAFVIDMEACSAVCPAGKCSVRWSQVQGTKNVAFRAFFGKQCRTCSFFRADACTTLASGRRLDISPHHATLQQRRKEQQTDEFRDEMKHRAAIEGTISEAVRGHGLRYNRYRGQAKTQLQAYFTATAINLKRLMAVV